MQPAVSKPATVPAAEAAGTPDASRPPRLVSLDVYRGFIMVILAGGGFGLALAARDHPESPVWEVLRYQFSHVEWRGCAFWDLVQPAFIIMVGVAIPYSYAARKARGASDQKMRQFAGGWVREQLNTHFGITHPIAAALGILIILWGVCW